jgi:polyisoprenoid-binding protein YceI
MSFPMKARFDRRGFGLRWNQDLDVGGIVVGDQVEVTARVELIRAGASRP